MPHQCVRCGTMYEDGSEEILKGCSCGAKLFFFVKKKDIEKSKETVENLSKSDRKKVEKDVFDMVGVQPEADSPVVLDFESIRVMRPGKFEIDLVALFNSEKPLIYKLEEGKYVIDLSETFMRNKKK
ncbi:MAG: Zn-ribbon domain-containing protein [Candidatus Nanoarchaeia archaeon]